MSSIDKFVIDSLTIVGSSLLYLLIGFILAHIVLWCVPAENIRQRDGVLFCFTTGWPLMLLIMYSIIGYEISKEGTKFLEDLVNKKQNDYNNVVSKVIADALEENVFPDAANWVRKYFSSK